MFSEMAYIRHFLLFLAASSSSSSSVSTSSTSGSAFLTSLESLSARQAEIRKETQIVLSGIFARNKAEKEEGEGEEKEVEDKNTGLIAKERDEEEKDRDKGKGGEREKEEEGEGAEEKSEVRVSRPLSEGKPPKIRLTYTGTFIADRTFFLSTFLAAGFLQKVNETKSVEKKFLLFLFDQQKEGYLFSLSLFPPKLSWESAQMSGSRDK